MSNPKPTKKISCKPLDLIEGFVSDLNVEKNL